jgi:hypothetical protein
VGVGICLLSCRRVSLHSWLGVAVDYGVIVVIVVVVVIVLVVVDKGIIVVGGGVVVDAVVVVFVDPCNTTKQSYNQPNFQRSLNDNPTM